MIKDELIEAIEKERAVIAEAIARIKDLRTELAKYAEWQVGDIVENVSDGLCKLCDVDMADDGRVRFIYGKRHYLDGGGAPYSKRYLDKETTTLIERPKQ